MYHPVKDELYYVGGTNRYCIPGLLFLVTELSFLVNFLVRFFCSLCIDFKRIGPKEKANKLGQIQPITTPQISLKPSVGKDAWQVRTSFGLVGWYKHILALISKRTINQLSASCSVEKTQNLFENVVVLTVNGTPLSIESSLIHLVQSIFLVLFIAKWKSHLRKL